MNIILIIVVAIILSFLLSVVKDNKESRKVSKEIENELKKIDFTKVKSVDEGQKLNLTDANLILKISDLHNQEKFIECIEACNRFLLNDQNHDYVLLMKADSLSLYGGKIKSVKLLEEAVDILEKLEKTKYKHQEILFVLGDTWIRLAFAKGKSENDENKIIECATISSNYYYKAHQMDLNNESILVELAFAKYIAGADDDAFFYINKAKAINPYSNRVIEIYNKLYNI